MGHPLDQESAVTEAVIRDLEQAGLLGHPKVNRQAIIDGLLKGDKDSLDVREYRTLQHYANPDTELQGTEPAIYGEMPEDLRKKMHTGFQGRGWTAEEESRLGRPVKRVNDSAANLWGWNPLGGAGELSAGDRFAQELQRRRTLAESLLAAQGPRPTGPYHYGMSPSGPVMDQPRQWAVEEYNRTKDLKFGESGWAGALENPEYLAGDAFTRYADPMVNYFQYRTHESMDGAEADRRAQELSRAAKMSNTQATTIPSHYNTSTPELKEQAYKKVKGIYGGLKPVSYDDSHRQATGQYPSYAGSTGRLFLENLADPTTLAVGIGGIQKAIRGELGAFGKAMLVDNGAEEIPTAAGIGALFGAFSNIPSNPFAAGNEARTDLYDPETKAPKTDQAFGLQMAEQMQDRQKAQSDYRLYERSNKLTGRKPMTR